MKKLLFIFSCLCSFAVMAQHTIEGQFTPAEDYKMTILYKVEANATNYVAYATTDEQGQFTITLDSTATKGIYRLVYANPQEENNFDIIYNAKEDIKLKFNRETGVEFTESVENQLMASYTQNMSVVSQSIGQFYRQQSTDSTALETIFTTQKETQKHFEEVAKGTLALEFIKGNTPYVPEQYEDIKTYINNLRVHYFKHVDFDNEVLQNSNFLIERVLNYVFGIVDNELSETENFTNNIDEVHTYLKDSGLEIQHGILKTLWQQMADAGLDAVANYITDTYLLNVLQELNYQESIKEVMAFKSVSVGQIAPDFVVDSKTNTRLSELEGDTNYLLIFWSSTCGHCLAEMPVLHEYLQNKEDTNYKVIAVGLEDDEIGWKATLNNFPDFTHVLGLGKWENEIGRMYGITATPAYFVLDTNEKIIAKPYDFKAFQKWLESE